MLNHCATIVQLWFNQCRPASTIVQPLLASFNHLFQPCETSAIQSCACARNPCIADTALLLFRWTTMNIWHGGGLDCVGVWASLAPPSGWGALGGFCKGAPLKGVTRVPCPASAAHVWLARPRSWSWRPAALKYGRGAGGEGLGDESQKTCCA